MLNELKSMRVLVTSTSFGKADPTLCSALEGTVSEVIYNPYGRPLTASELSGLIRGVDGFIAGIDDIDAAVIRSADRLKVISRYGTGVDRVDIQEATRRGIVVTNTPGANAVAVAELTLCLMLALARNLCAANQATHAGQWPRHTGISLREKCVGLVGFGHIGRAVALRLGPFGCRLRVTDPLVDAETARGLGAERVSLEQLLGESHFVSLHVPATPDTTRMINSRTIARMQRGAFLINTARGELIDEAALRDAILSGHLGGAALDVFAPEPPGPEYPLMNLPRVILTPHMASRTDDATNQMGRIALGDCLSVLRGERPLHPVNPEVLEASRP